MSKDFNILVKKINAFVRRYQLYEFLRGLLLFSITAILLFIIINLVEYKLFMPSSWRKILFITVLVFLGILFLRYVLFTGLQYLGIFKTINNRKASEMIRKYIPDVKDKLINILELHDNPESQYSYDITIAAVNQKIDEIKFFDFSKAVSMRQLKTLLLYFLASFVIVFGIHLINSDLFRESGNRIIHYNKEFVKPAPYTFAWENQIEAIEKGSDYKLLLKCEGNDIPSVMYINIGGNNFLMNSLSDNKFEYQLNSLVNSIGFYFTDLKYLSSNFFLNIIPVPIINTFTVEVKPPIYTSLKATKTENVGDMQIPKGSYVDWNFVCYDTDSLLLVVDTENILEGEKSGRNTFKISNRFLKPAVYSIKIKNEKTEYQSVMNFKVDIIEDIFPEIKVMQMADSTKLTRFYFKGNIHDDYGFSDLSFHVNIAEKDSAITLPFNKYVMPQEFYYSIDLQDYKVDGQTMGYFFSVTDNDGVNGPKTTTSESFTFTFPDKSEVEEKKEEDFKKIEELIKESQQIADELRSDLKDMQLKNINNNMTDWEKQQAVENMMQKKNMLEQTMDQIDNMYKEMSEYQNTFANPKQEIMEKQKEIEKLMENVMTDELKKLMEEFNQLANDFNEKKLNELSQKMDMSFDDLSKQLDRTKNLLKRMQMEQNLMNIAEKIEDIAEKQDKLADNLDENRSSEKGENSDGNSEKESSENQENGNKSDEMSKEEAGDEMSADKEELQKLREQLEKLLEENEELQNPIDFDNFSEDFDDIEEDMEKNMDDLSKEELKKLIENIKQTSKKMDSLASKMKQMLMDFEFAENEQNMQTIRQILKNLLVLSFSQENLLLTLRTTGATDPELTDITRSQNNLILQSEVIRDSLYVLASKEPKIGNVVNNELMAMAINLRRSSDVMNEGTHHIAQTNQQLVITAANNLALLLSESLDQMEEMEMPMPGQGGGKKKKKGKGDQMDLIKQQSEALKMQLQMMIEQMKNGEQPMSQQLGESLMMHEMMQQMLRELMQDGSMGQNTRRQLQEIDNLLEQNRRELVNKRVNSTMINRHNNITARLLEAEKSQLERDDDNKRESNTADDKFYSNPAKFFENENNQNITIENLQRSNLKLNNFYQNKFKNYVEKFNGSAQ